MRSAGSRSTMKPFIIVMIHAAGLAVLLKSRLVFASGKHAVTPMFNTLTIRLAIRINSRSTVRFMTLHSICNREHMDSFQLPFPLLNCFPITKPRSTLKRQVARFNKVYVEKNGGAGRNRTDEQGFCRPVGNRLNGHTIDKICGSGPPFGPLRDRSPIILVWSPPYERRLQVRRPRLRVVSPP